MKKIIVFELEPAPYKTDLWNYITLRTGADVKVLFLEKKDASPDAGHKFSLFPESKYETVYLYNYNFIYRFLYILHLTILSRKELFFLVGYHKRWNLLVVFNFILFRVNYLIFVDKVRELSAKKFRDNLVAILRKIVFSRSQAVLTCGRKSAIYTFENIFKRTVRVEPFNYYVDALAYLNAPVDPDIDSLIRSMRRDNRKIILFSGRMIDRKGLRQLIDALETIDLKYPYYLICEGDGPLLENLKQYANMKLSDNVLFTGFLDYQLHRFLISQVDIVVVPSLEDNWGIVVSEGVLLDKIVVASNAVGSAIEFMTSKKHFIFNASDINHLKLSLISALSHEESGPNVVYDWPNENTIRKFI